MRINFYGKTDVGVVRNKNEDYFETVTLQDGSYVFVVADGLGGHLAGEVASRTAVTNLIEMIKEGIGEDPITFFRESLEKISKEIEKIGNSEPDKKGMGTTLSLLYVKDNQGYIAHVGDSRIYKISHGKINQLTEDHSFVEKLVADGLITEEEARRHPRKNVLLQMIGMKKDVDPQIMGPFSIEEGDKFLLCTDGLSNLVSDFEIKEILGRLPIHEAVDYLVELAKKRGGPDNITAIGVSFGRELVLVEEEPTPVEIYTEDTREQEVPAIEEGNNRKLLLWIAILILALFLLGLGYYVFHNIQKERAANQEGNLLINISTSLQEWGEAS